MREAAALVLAKLGGKQAVAFFEAPLRDEEPKVRRAAIVALGLIGGREAGDLLMSRVDVEKDAGVRRALRLCLLAYFRNHPGRKAADRKGRKGLRRRVQDARGRR